ncbi:MAG TPA: hypothetical protein VGA06_00865 [Candidatus Paceibacterota bacterium]|jgi:hypothetical protein
MNFYRKYKNYILGAVAITLLFIAYSIVFRGGDSGPILQVEEVDPETAVEQDLLVTLLQLRSVELNGRIFSNPAFHSLRDFSQPIAPQPVGRNNPFAPLGTN